MYWNVGHIKDLFLRHGNFFLCNHDSAAFPSVGECANWSLMRQIGVEWREVEGDFLGLPTSLRWLADYSSSQVLTQFHPRSSIGVRERHRECLLTSRSSKMSRYVGAEVLLIDGQSQHCHSHKNASEQRAFCINLHCIPLTILRSLWPQLMSTCET